MGNLIEAPSLTSAQQAHDRENDGTPLGSLRAYLAMMTEVIKGTCSAPDDYAYPGGWHELVLKQGRSWGWAPRPDGVPKMPFKNCYENAMMLSLEYGLTYVEGFAAGMIPVQHAWCVDDQGAVVDPTWKDEEGAYFGIGFHPAHAARLVTSKGTWGLLDESHLDWLRNGIPTEVLA